MKLLFSTATFVMLCLISFQAQAQTFTRSSMKFALGLGSSENSRSYAGGYYFSVGYQCDLYKDRIRLNPNFTFGSYDNKGVDDGENVYFNSLNLQCIVYADVLRIGKFSYVMGAGIAGNNSRGIDHYSIGFNHYGVDYFSEFNIGGVFCNGFRIANPEKRVALEIMVLSLQYCTGEQIEINPMRIGIDIKL